MFAETRRRRLRLTAVLATALVAGCAGGGAQSGPMMPSSSGFGNGAGPMGNAVVRIFVPTSAPGAGRTQPPQSANNPPGFGGAAPGPIVATPPPGPAAPPPPGSQVLTISVSGPTTIAQTVTVGPNATGCSPAPGGTACQLSLPLPSGTYTGTVGAPNAQSPALIAFTVTQSGPNLFSLTTGGVPAQVAVVPASAMSAQNAQGGIDLYGAGRHPLILEMFDQNQNVIISGATANYALGQAGGALPISVTQASNGFANLFYVTANGTGNTSSALVRATANAIGAGSPCAQANAVCNGTVRLDVRQLLGVANSSANDVTLYVSGQSLPLATVQSGISNPQALIFDNAGDLFVASQPGSVSEYAPPYNAQPAIVANGVSRPQALAIDTRGDLFVANGSGSNTVTMYAPPYAGPPTTTIAAGIDDPVALALDPAGNLFVVNASANTVTEYAPPYASAPVVLSKGLNTPNSLALDARGNLFVANLNSTPNSVVEYSPPFTNQSGPVVTITNGINEQGTIAVGVPANLFVPNQGANTVTEYVAPYAGTPATIVGGQSQPIALAIDSLGNLYVANYGNNTVTEYAPPYVSASWSTFSSGISLPLALALSPATSAASGLVVP